ncbi:MAG: SIS domain-containing protein [bacterium]|nr:SIS domain-containing protein [bacterium]
MAEWISYTEQLRSVQEKLSVRDLSGKELGHEPGFSEWKKQTLRVRSEEKCAYFAGNGASASMASHFSTDIAKNGGVFTCVFSDFSFLTALSNDISYEEVFAEPLRWRMKQGDMLIAISSSGNSPNIVRAVETARNCGGIIVTLSAMGESNKIRGMGDLNFYVPAQTYGLAETSHAAILHFWTDTITGN